MMKLLNGVGNQQIIDVIRDHQKIGEILDRHEIGCVKCSIGTCLLQDVVRVHFLGDDVETRIEKEINDYLSSSKRKTLNGCRIQGEESQ
ncbi:hypothetical protein ACFL6N_03900 [Thermodesulfobacteriota bacterium]